MWYTGNCNSTRIILASEELEVENRLCRTYGTWKENGINQNASTRHSEKRAAQKWLAGCFVCNEQGLENQKWVLQENYKKSSARTFRKYSQQ